MATRYPAEHRLVAAPSSVRTARRAVLDAVGDTLHPDGLDAVLLATSEVVTNALEHGAPPIELRLQCDDTRVRVEVRDASPLPPRERSAAPGPAEVRGRGMVIVNRITDRWGIEELAEGKAVWFEVDLPR